MNKKILLVFLSAIMVCLVGCSSKEYTSSSSESKKDKSSQPEIAVEIPNDNKYVSGEIVTIDPVVGTADMPADVGDWIESKRYCSQDGTYHNIYFNIKEIIRDDNRTHPVLVAYNQKRHIKKFKSLPKESQYCIIKYDVFFPEDFPEDEMGIGNADLIFNIVKSNDSISEDLAKTDSSEDEVIEEAPLTDFTISSSEYVSISNVFDITRKPIPGKLHAGDIYPYGTAIFVLDRNEQDYFVTYTYHVNRDPMTNYIIGQ